MEQPAVFTARGALRALRPLLLLTAFLFAVWLLSGTSPAQADDGDAGTGAPQAGAVIGALGTTEQATAPVTGPDAPVDATVDKVAAAAKDSPRRVEQVADGADRRAKHVVRRVAGVARDVVADASQTVDDTAQTATERVADVAGPVLDGPEPAASPQHSGEGEASTRQGVSRSTAPRDRTVVERHLLPEDPGSPAAPLVPSDTPSLASSAAPGAPLDPPAGPLGRGLAACASGAGSSHEGPGIAWASLPTTPPARGLDRPAQDFRSSFGPEPAFAPGCSPD